LQIADGLAAEDSAKVPQEDQQRRASAKLIAQAARPQVQPGDRRVKYLRINVLYHDRYDTTN
jgi:hypothetical protein